MSRSGEDSSGTSRAEIDKLDSFSVALMAATGSGRVVMVAMMFGCLIQRSQQNRNRTTKKHSMRYSLSNTCYQTLADRCTPSITSPRPSMPPSCSHKCRDLIPRPRLRSLHASFPITLSRKPTGNMNNNTIRGVNAIMPLYQLPALFVVPHAAR